MLGKEHLLAHLFFKSISKYSVSTYKELCAGIGKVFKAVILKDKIADAVQGSRRFKSSWLKEVNISFSAQIACLEEENNRLSTDAGEVKRQLFAEAQR